MCWPSYPGILNYPFGQAKIILNLLDSIIVLKPILKIVLKCALRNHDL